MALQLNRGKAGLMGKTKHVSLEELRHRLIVEAKHNQDVLVKGRDIVYKPDGTVLIRNARDPHTGTDTEADGVYSWGDYAFTQFCDKIEVPPDFVRKCPVSGPSSKHAIVQHWKEQVDGKTFLLRIHNLDEKDPKTGATGLVRGFLSERFSMFDNLDMLNLAEPFIKDKGLEIHLGQATDKSFHMRLLDPAPHMVKMPGGKEDPHKIGIHVLNSEVGAYNCQGDFLLFRSICTNGIVVVFDKRHLFNHKHIGIETHEMRTAFAAALETMKDRTEVAIERIEMVATMQLDNPMGMLRQELKSRKATDDFVTMSLLAYESEPIPSTFGVVQAITRAAQGLPNIDQRLRMEEIAGGILLAA